MDTTESPMVLAICGSPRVGNTHWMLTKILEGASQEGAHTELFCVAEKMVSLCDGCLTCEESGVCHLDDDLQELYAKALSSDAILFGSPVHFDGVTPQLKNFIDRLNPISRGLKGKRGFVVTVGMLGEEEGRASRRTLIDYVRNVLGILEMEWGGALEAQATAPQEVAADRDVERQCLETGRRLAHELRRSSGEGISEWPLRL